MASLRSDEAPNPTPGFLRRLRRHGELMAAAAAGLSNDALAAQFGYTNSTGARAGVERARNGVAPSPGGEQRFVEYRQCERIAGVLTAHVKGGDHIAVDTYLETTDLRMQIWRAADREVFPQSHPDGIDYGATRTERGEWTPMLQQRADGTSFHSIAEEFGIDDWFDALTTIHHDLHAYHQHSGQLLRATQLRDLDDRIREHRHRALGSPCDLAAAATSMRLLHRRATVRGLFWEEPQWWSSPCPPYPIP